MRFRFDGDELALLRAAEQLRGAELARVGRPETLRDALTLARVVRRSIEAGPGGQVTLTESELRLVAEGVRYSAEEVRWLGDQREGTSRGAMSAVERQRIEQRREALAKTFPDLVERGGWRGFGLRRALEGLAGRLNHALAGEARPPSSS